MRGLAIFLPNRGVARSSIFARGGSEWDDDSQRPRTADDVIAARRADSLALLRICRGKPSAMTASVTTTPEIVLLAAVSTQVELSRRQSPASAK